VSEDLGAARIDRIYFALEPVGDHEPHRPRRQLRLVAGNSDQGNARRIDQSFQKISAHFLSNLWRALIETATENTFCDLVLQDFQRTTSNHPATCATDAILHEAVFREPGRAHDLKRFVRRPETCLVTRKLGK